MKYFKILFFIYIIFFIGCATTTKDYKKIDTYENDQFLSKFDILIFKNNLSSLTGEQVLFLETNEYFHKLETSKIKLREIGFYESEEKITYFEEKLKLLSEKVNDSWLEYRKNIFNIVDNINVIGFNETLHLIAKDKKYKRIIENLNKINIQYEEYKEKLDKENKTEIFKYQIELEYEKYLESKEYTEEAIRIIKSYFKRNYSKYDDNDIITIFLDINKDFSSWYLTNNLEIGILYSKIDSIFRYSIGLNSAFNYK